MKKIILTLIAIISSFSFNLYAADNKILVVYFSNPENVKSNGIDGIASASVQYFKGERVGSTEKFAKIIAEQTKGDIFRVETEIPYPTEHEALVDFAETEKDRGEKPKLKNHIGNLQEYDTIFLGYPIWWYGLPMPVLSFLDEYDLSEKNIIPFSTHGGSRFSGTISELADLEPNAKINKNGLTISRGRMENSDKDIIAWLKELGY